MVKDDYDLVYNIILSKLLNLYNSERKCGFPWDGIWIAFLIKDNSQLSIALFPKLHSKFGNEVCFCGGGGKTGM